MLPLGLLKTAQGHPILVELKNGETYNGHLVNCDTWMNVHLKEVICTSKDGDRFWRIAETYVRGNTIKYIRVPDDVIDKVQDDVYVQKPAEGPPCRGGSRTGPVFVAEQQPQQRTQRPPRGRVYGRNPSDRQRGRWPSGRGQAGRGTHVIGKKAKQPRP